MTLLAAEGSYAESRQFTPESCEFPAQPPGLRRNCGLCPLKMIRADGCLPRIRSEAVAYAQVIARSIQIISQFLAEIVGFQYGCRCQPVVNTDILTLVVRVTGVSSGILPTTEAIEDTNVIHAVGRFNIETVLL